jgi:hypothetical protein
MRQWAGAVLITVCNVPTVRSRRLCAAMSRATWSMWVGGGSASSEPPAPLPKFSCDISDIIAHVNELHRTGHRASCGSAIPSGHTIVCARGTRTTGRSTRCLLRHASSLSDRPAAGLRDEVPLWSTAPAIVALGGRCSGPPLKRRFNYDGGQWQQGRLRPPPNETTYPSRMKDTRCQSADGAFECTACRLASGG